MYTRHGVPAEPNGPGEVERTNISAELFTIPLDDGKFHRLCSSAACGVCR